MQPNTLSYILATEKRISERDELLKNRGYKGTVFDTFCSSQTRSIITLFIILSLFLYYIYH